MVGFPQSINVFYTRDDPGIDDTIDMCWRKEYARAVELASQTETPLAEGINSEVVNDGSYKEVDEENATEDFSSKKDCGRT